MSAICRLLLVNMQWWQLEFIYYLCFCWILGSYCYKSRMKRRNYDIHYFSLIFSMVCVELLLSLKYLLITVQLAEFQLGLTKLALLSGHLSSSQVRLYCRLVICCGDASSEAAAYLEIHVNGAFTHRRFLELFSRLCSFLLTILNPIIYMGWFVRLEMIISLLLLFIG